MLSSLLEVDGIQDTAQNAIGMHSEFFSEHTDLSFTLPEPQPACRWSDSRIIFYIAGYVARKCILKRDYKHLLLLLTMPAPDENFQLARLTLFRDKGRLLYPSGRLFSFIKKLEDLFKGCFSCEELHADSILNVPTVVKARLWQEIGCSSHASTLSKKIIHFYVVTRLHFHIMGLNVDKAGKWQKAKHLKISHCSLIFFFFLANKGSLFKI